MEDYEKKYKGAMEVMRQWIAPCHTQEQLNVLKTAIFPELKESEDERIKKELKKIEQKPTDKVGPKFKVGDVIRLKGGAAEYTIRSVTSTTYYTDGWSYDIEGCEEDYELVEQKSTWSEDDEQMINDIIEAIDKQYTVSDYQEMVNWLKSIKERYTWKASDVQIRAIEDAINFLGCTKKVREDLKSLYEQLKKLR